MADSFGVDLVNGPQFAAALARMRADITEPKAALDAAATTLARDAAAAAPRASGRLAGSHRVLAAAGNRARIVADTPYAAAIHWGWPGHGIGRRPWLVATWLRNPGPLDSAAAAVQAGIDKAAAAT